jgi:hypothetical protein
MRCGSSYRIIFVMLDEIDGLDLQPPQALLELPRGLLA